MKGQLDDHALATLMRAAQGGNTQAYVLLLKEITPRLRQISPADDEKQLPDGDHRCRVISSAELIRHLPIGSISYYFVALSQSRM